MYYRVVHVHFLSAYKLILSDINECIAAGKRCSQKCVNSDGSFKCHCFTGYQLEDDGVTCTGVTACGVLDQWTLFNVWMLSSSLL